LHAAPWADDGQPRCLLDDLDVRFAPSAIAVATSLRRAAERSTAAPILVGLGDPTDDLPAAGPEVEEIARRFGDDRSAVALHNDADSGFLRAHVPSAHFVHLACHARGGLFDSAESAVLLADGWQSAFDLTALPTLDARLVAVSACQSALSELAGMPDEVLSLGTAMLAAGSACAVASLWPVDDAATGLLMVRLYDEMLLEARRPPEALRRSQRWLRDLTRRDRDTYLAGHPALEAELRRRAERGDPLAQRAPTNRRAANDDDDRPYAHAELWAAFVAVGA
jgi:CHAT domain-containing protein